MSFTFEQAQVLLSDPKYQGIDGLMRLCKLQGDCRIGFTNAETVHDAVRARGGYAGQCRDQAGRAHRDGVLVVAGAEGDR